MNSVSAITGAHLGGSSSSTSATSGGQQYKLTDAKPDSVSFAGSGGQGQKSHLGIIGSMIACCAIVPVLAAFGAVGVGLYLARNTLGSAFKLVGKAGSGIKHLASKPAQLPGLNIPQLPQVLYRP